MNTKVQAGNIEFTRINNDVYGNPRYVCHYHHLLSEQNKQDADKLQIWQRISAEYNLALMNGRALGGRKFHNKQYGGGIVFQSYNIADTAKRIAELVNS